MSVVQSTVQYRDLSSLGYPGYRVGDDGSVWSRRRRVWRKGVSGSSWEIGGEWHELRRLLHNGYPTVVVYPGQTRVAVHRLVLMAFVGPPPQGADCCHADGDPANNRLGNLRWDTRTGNMADAVLHGRVRRGSAHGMSTLDESRVRFIRANAGRMSQKELAKHTGTTRSNVSNVLRRKSWAWLE
jgi:hypothetical protein